MDVYCTMYTVLRNDKQRDIKNYNITLYYTKDFPSFGLGAMLRFPTRIQKHSGMKGSG